MHIELAKVTALSGKYKVTEFNPSICDVTVTRVSDGGMVVAGTLRINVKLYNISSNIFDIYLIIINKISGYIL